MAINIKEINRKHLLKSDVVYRINYGLSSRLVNFRNGIMYLEVMFTRKWKKIMTKLQKNWRCAGENPMMSCEKR